MDTVASSVLYPLTLEGDLTIKEVDQKDVNSEFVVSDYMQGICHPTLGATDLELTLDYHDSTHLSEFFNFDSKKVLARLVERTKAQKIPPQIFKEEICELLAYVEPSLPCYREIVEVSCDEEDYLRYSSAGKCSSRRANTQLIPSKDAAKLKDSAKNDSPRRNTLMQRYQVSTSGTDPDVISITRLRIMFPHYYLATLHRDQLYGQSEFAGVIPRKWEEFYSDNEGLKCVLALHLLTLQKSNTSTSKRLPIPFRSLQVVVKHRMESSLLSDDRRIRFLQNNGFILEDGSPTTQTISDLKAFERDLEKSIFWKLFL